MVRVHEFFKIFLIDPCQAALDTDGIVMVCPVLSVECQAARIRVYGCIVIGCQAALDSDLIVIEA